MIAILLALTLSGGSYAYTYATAGVTTGATDMEGDFATSNATADETQPDWASIVVEEQQVETQRPYAKYNTNLTKYPEDAEENWSKVDDVIPDGDSTYVYIGSPSWLDDLYEIPDRSGWGTVDYVKVYIVGKVTVTPDQASIRAAIETGGSKYYGTEELGTTSYVEYSYQWNVHPGTLTAWTWDEIDAMRIGVSLRRPKAGENTLCTQVYVEIGYRAMIQSGNIPIGNLFTVTVHPDYTGDLLVNVYLTNTGDLTKAYQYLNMELTLEGADENPKLLTLQNGKVSWYLEDSATDNYTVSVTGGGFYLVSGDSTQWSEGWSITPGLYSEVSQR